jgi:hypothetical protein
MDGKIMGGLKYLPVPVRGFPLQEKFDAARKKLGV